MLGFLSLSSRSRCPQCWEDGFFNRASLHSLGLICHLEHGGTACPVESQSYDLLIVDINGWHKVQVKFCACGSSTSRPERYRQLLRMRWYPASFNRPRTAFSFDLLETYHKLTLQGKINLYDFYHAVMHKSNNQGQLKPVVRFVTIIVLPQLIDASSTGITRCLVVCASGGISKV